MISANSASYYYMYIHMLWLILYDVLVITNLVGNTSAFTFATGRTSDTSTVACAPSRA